MKKLNLIIDNKFLSISSQAIFDYFWHLPKIWFEPPNYCRGGWSGVIKHTLPDGNDVFVKLQSKAVYKNLKHPIKGSPTFYRELINTLRAKKVGVNVLDLVYYGQVKLDAILVSKSLVGYQDLNQVLRAYAEDSLIRQAILSKVSENLTGMHKAKIKHGALYEKHVLVRVENLNDIDIRLIDFEKSKKVFTRMNAVERDLYTLFRSCTALQEKDRNYLLLSYKNLLPTYKFRSLKQKIQQKVKKRSAEIEKFPNHTVS